MVDNFYQNHQNDDLIATSSPPLSNNPFRSIYSATRYDEKKVIHKLSTTYPPPMVDSIRRSGAVIAKLSTTFTPHLLLLVIYNYSY